MKFPLERKDNVSYFINVCAPFEPVLFLGKSQSFVQFPVIIIVVKGSALQINLPYVTVTRVERRLSGRAAVTDEQCLPKVDVRKQLYQIVSYREKKYLRSMHCMHRHLNQLYS